MPMLPISSRTRFGEYRRELKTRWSHQEHGQDPAAGRSDTGGSAGVTPANAASPIKLHTGRTRRSFLTLMREFLTLLAEERRTVALSLALLAVATLLGLAPPAATKFVVDYVLLDKPVPAAVIAWLPFLESGEPRVMLTGIALIVLAIALVALVIHITSRWRATQATKRAQMSIRRRVFEHAVHLPLHRIFALKSGGAASLLREDAGAVGELIFSMLYNPCRAVIQLVGSLVILAIVDWRLLLGALILLPVVYLTHRTWISRIRPLYADIRASRQHIDSHATESFGGMRVVRSFDRQVSEAARFTRNNHFMARQELFTWWWARWIDIAWSVLVPAASAALLWYGGISVLEGAITVGDLLMFLTYLLYLLGPLEALVSSATQFQNNLAGLDRVLDVLAEPTEMQAKPGAIVLQRPKVRGAISLENVSFAYPGTAGTVLHEINVNVRAGEVVALVGPSGSGKTTICNLVARFYDPTEGAVRLDGVDLRDIEVHSYRRLLGIVEQDIFLFDGTIAQNIGYARRDASMDDIVRASQLANAHGFITGFETGYETMIGERGVRLSGGQRQRIAIARALLADPRILILDEATSNLDTESERLIQSSLQTLMRDRTSFVIAHRLSTIAHADRIVVLEDGRVIEQGTHLELMARSGRYRQMVDLQTHPDQLRAREMAPNRGESLPAF